MRRQIKFSVFGVAISIPVGLILAALGMTGVAAWAILHLLASSSVSATATSRAPAPNLTFSHQANYCNVNSGTGAVSCVWNADGSMNVTVTGIDNNAAGGNATVVYVTNKFVNNGTVPVCWTFSYTPVAGLAVTNMMGTGPVAPGADGYEGVSLDFGGIQPSQVLTAVPFTFDFVSCP